MTATRERIKTDNEKWGNGYLNEDAPGGVWMVLTEDVVRHLFTNRAAAEAYVYEDMAAEGYAFDDYSIQVWSVSETWPDEEEES